MPLTQAEQTNVTRIVCDLRADWNEAGVLAAVRKVCHRSLTEVLTVGIAVANDPSRTTPAAIGDETDSHWRLLGEVPEASPKYHEVMARCWHCGRDRTGCAQVQGLTGLDIHPFTPQAPRDLLTMREWMDRHNLSVFAPLAPPPPPPDEEPYDFWWLADDTPSGV